MLKVQHQQLLSLLPAPGLPDSSEPHLSPQMMQNLLLEEGDLVAIRSVSLPKGSFVKLQPHTKDFLDISNPRAVLEMTLRGFSCLTKGDCILMHYNNKRFYIDIVECRPQVPALAAPDLTRTGPRLPPQHQPALGACSSVTAAGAFDACHIPSPGTGIRRCWSRHSQLHDAWL